MKVKELIEALKKCDPEMEVVVPECESTWWQYATDVTVTPTGSTVDKDTRVVRID